MKYDHGNAVKFEECEGVLPEWVIDALRVEVSVVKDWRVYHDGVITRRWCESGVGKWEFVEESERCKVKCWCEKGLWDDREEDENMTRIMKGVEFE